MTDRAERRRVLRMVIEDLANDAQRWDGQDFTGRNVATMFGELAATVAALAAIVLAIDEEADDG